jgi:DNA-directed RNA polymerase specialized sigma24 family protein
VPISIEVGAADEAYRLEPVDDITAERAFERRWALTLLDRVLDQLRAEYAARGQRNLFDQIKATITFRDVAARYGKIAADLRMSEGAVKVAVHRLRKRYRELLVHQVSQTVSTVEQIDDEINDLFKALSQ